jgi:hypothetical protein
MASPSCAVMFYWSRRKKMKLQVCSENCRVRVVMTCDMSNPNAETLRGFRPQVVESAATRVHMIATPTKLYPYFRGTTPWTSGSPRHPEFPSPSQMMDIVTNFVITCTFEHCFPCLSTLRPHAAEGLSGPFYVHKILIPAHELGVSVPI